MIDTVRFQAFPVYTFPPLEKGREIVDPATGLCTQTGCLDNMHVTLRSDGELVVQGSLPRFLLGDNNGSLRRCEVEEAVRKFASAFEVQPEACRVYRLDLAATMLLPRPVALYLDVLGSAPHMKRRTHGNETVAFDTRARTLHFYDKGKKAKLPGHLLRFEVQYKKKKELKHRLGREVTLADLYDPAFFAGLVRRWQWEYHRVRKRRRYLLMPTTSKKDLMQQLAGIGLDHAGGGDVVLRQIDAGEGDRQQKCRLRSAVMSLATEGNSRADADLIGEFDAAVEEARRLALVH